MPQTINVGQQTTFQQLVDTFGTDRQSDHHLRLKGGEQGKTLYVHSKSHGVPHKRAQIMERRLEASNFVIERFREQYRAHPRAIEKVLSHMMESPEFDKRRGELHLRGSDINRMAELAELGIKQEQYTRSVWDEAIGRVLGINVFGAEEGIPQKTLHEVEDYQTKLEAALKDEVAFLSSKALENEQVQDMCWGNMNQFRAGSQGHTGLFLSPEFLRSPELGELRLPMNALLALQAVSKPEDVRHAIVAGMGAPISEPILERTGVGLLDLRMDGIRKLEWSIDQIEQTYFGEDNVLGLSEDEIGQLRNTLVLLCHKRP